MLAGVSEGGGDAGKKMRVKKHNKWMQEHNEGRKGKYLWGNKGVRKEAERRKKKVELLHQKITVLIIKQ